VIASYDLASAREFIIADLIASEEDALIVKINFVRKRLSPDVQ